MNYKTKIQNLSNGTTSPTFSVGALAAAVLAATLASTMGTTALAQNDGSKQLEEVLVTAQKKVESLQDVPSSISVLGNETLEAARLQYSSDIVHYSPNLAVNPRLKQGYANYYIRGVGASDDSLGSNPSIGFLVDGIFANSAGGNVTSVLDVEQIEVIRGPQGTMFGRNTIGGVINIISKKPQDEFSAKIRAGYGNYNRVDVAASATGPLVPGRLNGSIGVAYSEHDGYVENTVPGRRDAEEAEDTAFRAALMFTPTDSFEAVVAGDFSQLDGTHYGSQNVGTSILGYSDNNDIREGSYDARHEVETENWGVSAILTWQLDAGELKWLNGYRYSELLSLDVDYDATPDDIYLQRGPQEEESFSSELQFAFDIGERSSWVIGAFYLDSEGLFDNGFNFFGFTRAFTPAGGNPPIRLTIDAATTAWSVFANADFELTERLTLAVGGRYSDSDKDFALYQGIELDFVDAGYAGAFDRASVPEGVIEVPIGGNQAKTGFSRFNPRAALQFQKTDDLMLFASVAQGHRDGGFDLSGSTYDIELLTAYELGLKSTLMDGSARLNLTAFLYDYTDIQVQESVILPGNVIVVQIANVAEAESYGLEAELAMNVTPNFYIAATLGLLNTEFTKGASTGNPATGNEFAFSPDVTFSFIPEYTVAAIDAGDVVLRGEWLYASSQFHEIDNRPEQSNKGRHLINASANFTSNDGSWQVSLWGKNLADEEYIVASADLIELSGTINNQYGDPRTYGVSFTYNIR